MATIDDWKKIEIKIGTIISAEKIPEGTKLLKLIVDFGAEQRQIMSGIACIFRIRPSSRADRRRS